MRPSTGCRAAICRTTRRTRMPVQHLIGAGMRDRLLRGGERGCGFPADRGSRAALGSGARPHSAARLGADAHRLVEAHRSRRLPELRRDRPAHARTRHRCGAISDRGAGCRRIRLRGDRHRCRAGLSLEAAVPLPLLHARRGPLRAAVPDESRSAAADRRGDFLRARSRSRTARAVPFARWRWCRV